MSDKIIFTSPYLANVAENLPDRNSISIRESLKMGKDTKFVLVSFSGVRYKKEKLFEFFKTAF